MAKILFNYNLCDKAKECGGIAVCPHGAIYFDQEQQKPVWDESKCTFCLKCTTIDACPIGCILYARDGKEEKKISNMIAEDPRTQKWLWKERFGVEPATTQPIAQKLTPKNRELISLLSADLSLKSVDLPIKSVNLGTANILIDVWHEDFLGCRLNAVLFEDLLGDSLDQKNYIEIFKLNASKFPDLAENLDVSTYPTLLLYKSGEEKYRHEGNIDEDEIEALHKEIDQAIKKN